VKPFYLFLVLLLEGDGYMRKMILLVVATGLIGLLNTGCSTFEGVAGDPGETYTTRYNMPAERIVPYNSQEIDNKESPGEVPVCEGVASREGFQCQ
jgi:hypothetical protein